MLIGPRNKALAASNATRNLLTKTEVFGNAVWVQSATGQTADTTLAPNGTTTADTLTTSNVNHAKYQAVTVTPHTQYTFSFFAMRGTMSDLKYSVYNNTGAADIVAATSYYSQTNASYLVRISLTFVTPAACVLIRCYPLRDSGVTGTMFIWGAQLVAGPVPRNYVSVA